MENLRSSRWLILGMITFVALMLIFLLSDFLRINLTAQPLNTPTQTEPSTVTISPLNPTETFTTTPTFEFTPVGTVTAPISTDSTLPAYPVPGDSGSNLFTPPPTVQSPTLGPYPGFETPGAYPGPSQGATQPATPLGATQTFTPTPTFGPSPTSTQFATPRPPLYLPCNLGEFIGDVTLPPGTLVFPGQDLVKIWSVRNGGSCTWTTAYQLIFDRGNRMEARKSNSLTSFISPNSISNISLSFTTPAESGTAKGFWLLRSDKGEEFGLGINRDQPLEVKVEVRPSNPELSYDFVNNMCLASWRSTFGSINCQSDPNSNAGSVVALDDPIIEINRLEDEPTLWTRPGTLTGSSLTGTYPAYTVQNGDHFIADVGCLEGVELCDVIISVGYISDVGTQFTLGTYEEGYDGEITRINIDLSQLAGQSIRFVLGVRNIGQAGQASTFWLAPGIRNLP